MSDPDPTEGLPPDLVALLRDPRIIVPQDAGVFEMIAKWMNAPSDTASASYNPQRGPIRRDGAGEPPPNANRGSGEEGPSSTERKGRDAR